LDRVEFKRQLNEEFKTITIYDSLITFIQKVSKNDFRIYSKRKGKRAFDFSNLFNVYGQEVRIQDKVHYLYDDGISTGSGKIKNLYRFLEVDE
jgi:hypothetical protein